MITESPVFTSEKSTTFVTIVGLHRIEKFFPSVNRTLKERYPSSCQCEIQSTFLPCTLRVPSPQLFILLLDSSLQPPVFCRADRHCWNTVHHHGLGFFLLRHARPPARCS